MNTQNKLSAAMEAMFPRGSAELEMRTLSSDRQWIAIRPRDGGLIEIGRKNAGAVGSPAWRLTTIHMVPPMVNGGIDKISAAAFANAVLLASKLAEYWDTIGE